MSYIKELSNVCQLLGFQYSLMNSVDAPIYIQNLIKKYNIFKTTGHLQLMSNYISVPTDENEFTFSKYLKHEPACFFFDQHNSDKNQVFIIEDGRNISTVMENACGMEYFVSNLRGDYILAVNWYVIQADGTAKEWMQKLKSEK